MQRGRGDDESRFRTKDTEHNAEMYSEFINLEFMYWTKVDVLLALKNNIKDVFIQTQSVNKYLSVSFFKIS